MHAHAIKLDRNYLALAQGGSATLRAAATDALTSELTPNSALTLGAWLDTVAAGLEPPSTDHARMAHALEFYVGRLILDKEVDVILALSREPVWAMQDAIKAALLGNTQSKALAN